jgi:hypothetical protein
LIQSGNDGITTGEGEDLVLGRIGDDTMATNGGNDIVLGDNGQVRYDGPDNDATTIDLVTTLAPESGGSADALHTGEGNDVALGGLGGDNINAADGDNFVFGDDGELV